MLFVIGTSTEIIGTSDECMARLRFISDITGVVPTPWRIMTIAEGKKFLICGTSDNVNGVYITAHNYEVVELCKTRLFIDKELLVANTCVYSEGFDTKLLQLLRKGGSRIELFFAKQELEVTEDRIIRNTNTLRDVGNYGFMTSKSDRLMFMNRKKGVREAIKLSFDKVSELYRV